MSAVKEEKKVETKETFWTPSEKESLKEQYGCEILIENGSLDEVNTTDAPSDAWIITYEIDGTVYRDLTRGTRVKLFDMYYSFYLYHPYQYYYCFYYHEYLILMTL